MSVCPKCARSVEDGWRVCPTCAASLEAATFTQAPVSATASSSGVEEGRFPAGTVLAGRYRILGLLGQGGMGEVYRAFDQILNQAVALKFLAAGELGEAALARFRNEVRVARQVSHPNVCRVYDIGFAEGTHFISMEYLDGENLASLLRRIGRLPTDKATEFTRKLCAGLAAAHERGVLHRDLKPANIMIDGRGQVRITDFGLAAFAREVQLSDLRSGTPAYMSPEQKAGKEVTTRSDIYSLGLVLYEMFTGKRRGDSASSPTDLVKDLDPAIERIILRCLEEDPRRRPSSPLNLAMALPGADPIAAALAAGETPSPEMVAASEGKEGFRPRTAVACFAVIVIAVLIGMVLTNRTSLYGHAPLPIPPDGLAFRAQEILKRLGYAEQYRSTAYGFACCSLEAARNAERYGARRDEVLASHRPAVISFWYRRHREEIPSIAAVPTFATLFTPGVIGPAAPPNTEPGMIRLQLDPTGRLTELEIRPWTAEDIPLDPPDWTSLFAAAELDPARFTPVADEGIPPMAFDERQSWTGTYADDRPEQIRVEAALWRGRPVFFEETLVSSTRERLAPVSNTTSRLIGTVALALVACLVATSFTALRNLRLGRSDRRGAAVLAGTAFCLLMVKWVLVAGHVAGVAEMGLLLFALCVAVFGAGILWLFYIAIEPVRSPQLAGLPDFMDEVSERATEEPTGGFSCSGRSGRGIILRAGRPSRNEARVLHAAHKSRPPISRVGT